MYENESYYDPIKKQSRSHRRLIGKIDSKSGEIVPTGKRGRPRKIISEESSGTGTVSPATMVIDKLKQTIKQQEEEIDTLKREIKKLQDVTAQCMASFETIIHISDNSIVNCQYPKQDIK